MQEYTFNIQETGMRLDMYLVERFSSEGVSFSRSGIQKLIRDGNVLLNGASAKPHHKIKSGEEVRVVIPPEEPSELKPQDMPLEIVYEDEDVLVINKPRGLVVHPAAGNPDGTLVNALLFHCKNLSGVNPERPGIVHRLDKDTAGLLVVAKNNAAHLHLARQFSTHSVKRIYAALVLGRVEFDENIVDLPIGRSAFNRQMMAVDFKEEAKDAVTRYRVIKRYKDFTYLELTPQTGRTHQLRVHMASLGHPILGDPTYGRKHKATKLALYARYIGFVHPKTEKFMEFEHALPDDMQKILSTATA